MENKVYIKVYSNQDLYKCFRKVIMPLESVITLSVYNFCLPTEVKIMLVSEKNVDDDSEFIMLLDNQELPVIDHEQIPWQVASCVYPVVMHDDLIITGLCAVARHICKYRTRSISPCEHEEGLLGFRQSCLQAPNETSIWTKFCEVDMVNTVQEIININKIDVLPTSLIRFENHLNKPVKVHNVYKIARQLKKNSLNKTNDKDGNSEDISNNTTRITKSRKWKSNIKKELEIDCSTKIEDLDINHQFAEGPFLTLADLILYPNFYIVINIIREDRFKSILPLTFSWYESLTNIVELNSLNKLLNTLTVNPCELDNVIIPTTDDVSLYKCDPKRHNPKKRLFTKEDDIEAALNTLVDGMELLILDNDFIFNEINWETVPDGANPAAGHLPDDRKDRKSQQLENLAMAVLKIAQDEDFIVDFCSGSGHLGILIAHLLPSCKVILLENKEQSLLRARKRVKDMGLKNVYFFQCNLDFFIGKFNIGIALHACGLASDLVLDKCLRANAKFVLCPCCYGSLHATDRLVYPRSGVFSSLSIDKYLCIGHSADQTHEDHPLTVRGARCMAVIDSDRARLAEEFGYSVTLTRLKPLSCTPKNNLLIGVPS